ncbi:recombinase family protein [Pseudomonas sp. NPDC077649]|uniref:recombinase family protein n=1 Tax=Pseudomonas sp. NPDC077649 TaxID=3364423 RepID=UPI0037C818F9
MKTLAYVRVASDLASEGAQRHDIAQAHHVEYWFQDVGLSGSTVGLPGFAKLCKLAKRGDIVIVASIMCLGSCNRELFESLQALRKKGASVVSLEGFDSSSPAGKAYFATAASLARLEDRITGKKRDAR